MICLDLVTHDNQKDIPTREGEETFTLTQKKKTDLDVHIIIAFNNKVVVVNS